MPITTNEFINVYPDFCDVDRHLIDHALQMGRMYCGHWPTPSRDFGIQLVAAHILTMRWFQTAEVAAAAAQIAEGGGGMVPGEGMDDFLKTFYGRQYVQLRDLQFIPGTIAI